MSEPTAPSAEAAPPAVEATAPPAEILPALASFERGDFRGASASVAPLLTHPTPQVQSAARALAARMATDPWAVRLGLLAVTLLALVTAIFAR
jgi:hypothetical protein